MLHQMNRETAQSFGPRQRRQSHLWTSDGAVKKIRSFKAATSARGSRFVLLSLSSLQTENSTLQTHFRLRKSNGSKSCLIHFKQFLELRRISPFGVRCVFRSQAIAQFVQRIQKIKGSFSLAKSSASLSASIRSPSKIL